MNNYSSRAEYYQYEFGTDEDFQVVGTLLKHSEKAMAEIPCGSGRLLPLYQQIKRRVWMIDLERNMVKKCEERIEQANLQSRVRAVCDDMMQWQSPEKLQLIIMPRGGIQLLANIDEVRQTLVNLSESIAPEGLLYLDIACPWTAGKDTHLLPEFMRFGQNNNIKGKEVFPMSEGEVLTRYFEAIMKQDAVIAKFSFSVGEVKETKRTYSADYRWIKIDSEYLLHTLGELGYVSIQLYGDYLLKEYSKDSARLLCLAQKQMPK